MQSPTIRLPRLARLRLLPLALGTALLLAQAASRTWTYTYYPNGLPASVGGPRTDVADTTSYDTLGRRTQVQNALGHYTTTTSGTMTRGRGAISRAIRLGWKGG